MGKFRVNFLIVGTQKGGTTALASFLGQEPRICMAPCKEVHFFDAPNFDDSADIDSINRRYQKAFPNFASQPLVGEATPIYMYFPQVAARIKQYNPDMKLIFLLRDPTSRAISHYGMEYARGNEKWPLPMALALEPFRLWRDRGDASDQSSWRLHSYMDRGLYSRQIKNMKRYFPPDQMLFLRSEDLWRDHEGTLRKTYQFLGLGPDAVVAPQERVYVAQKTVRGSPFLLQLIKWRFSYERRFLARLLN